MSPRSLLDQLTSVPLAKPCDSSWEAMHGDDKVRRCAACARDVFSLSEMTAVEAELRLLNAGDAAPCIRYTRDADGGVRHVPALTTVHFQPGSPTRALVMASALGVALAPSAALAKPKAATSGSAAPTQCVVFTQPANAPAEPPASAPVAAAPAPSPRVGAAAAPAARAPAAPSPAPPPPPMVLGGAPVAATERAPFGTLTVKSKIARELRIAGIALKAPLPGYFLTPGDFVIEVTEPGGKQRKVRAKIKRDETTVIDLDK